MNRILDLDDEGGIAKVTQKLKRVAACPVNRRAPVRMTKRAFVAACLKHVKPIGGSLSGHHGWRPCDECKTGAVIMQKKHTATLREITLPPGVTVITAKQHEMKKLEAAKNPAIYKRPWRYEEALISIGV